MIRVSAVVRLHTSVRRIFLVIHGGALPVPPQAVWFLLLALSASLSSAQSPLEIKGVRLGMTMDELRARMPAARCAKAECFLTPDVYTKARCGDFPKDLSQASLAKYFACAKKAQDAVAFGPVEPESYSFLFNKEGRVDFAQVRYDAKSHSAVVEALIVKFGKPRSDESESPGNRVVRWTRFESDAVLVARQRFSQTDYAGVTLFSSGYLLRSIQEGAEKSKEAAKRL